MPRPLIVLVLFAAACGNSSKAVIVGSKPFTESILLAEITARHIENATDYAVERRLNLGGTFLCHEGLLAGEIDLYPEYSGTALTAILGMSVGQDREVVRRRVESAYRERFHVEWMKPFGFNNTFAVVMRGEQVAESELKTITDLARVSPRLKIGFGFEFLEREDGYAGLVETYDLRFAEEPRTMDLGLVVHALAEGQIDVGVGDSTDGLIAAKNLAILEDDRGYFPPYDAALVVRADAFERFPALRGALDQLGGRLDETHMQKLNYEIAGKGRLPEAVARELLEEWDLDVPQK